MAAALIVCAVQAKAGTELKREKDKSNFYEIRSQFLDYYADKNIKQKGKGWKAFKRWEWFWAQRVAPTGDFPRADYMMHERKRYTERHRGKFEQIRTIGEWSQLGPSSSVGGYNGLGRVNAVREDLTNSQILWAGAASGGVWKSTNGGTNWSTNTDEWGSIGVSDIVVHPTNGNIVYVATGDADHWDTRSIGVMKTTDGGLTWNQTGLNWSRTDARVISRLLMHPTDYNILYAATSNGVYKTTNAGSTWSQLTTNDFNDMEFKPGDPTVMYGANTGFYRSTDGGASWTQITSGLATSSVQRIAIGVTPHNPSFVYALYANSANSGFLGFYKSTNSGANWTLMVNTPNMLGWSQTGDDTGGQGWYDLCVAASPLDSNCVFIGGVNVWKSTNGGATWAAASNWTGNMHADQHDLYFVPGTSRLYVGNDGGVYKTTNLGTAWNWIGNGMITTQFYRLGVSQTNANVTIAGAQDNGTKRWGNTAGWEDVMGGDGMECMIDYSNASIMYGTYPGGEMARSNNGGSSFSSLTMPQDGSWVTPFVIHPSVPATIFVGLKQVWKSTNRGDSWSRISTFSDSSSNVDMLQIAPSNADYIYMSKGSTLRRTTDGGGSWTNLTSPSSNSITYMAIHQSNPNKIWVTVSGFTSGQKVYQSTNGGSSWTNISGTLPNVPANTIVFQNNFLGRLYVGTDIGVYYRDSTATDWVDFNTNLPNVVIDELEIQYSTSKLRAATFGRGLWEVELPGVTVTTNVLADSVFSTGATISVGYTVGATPFNAGNIFTAQLSDGSGSFDNPTVIGTVTATTTGTISANLPQSLLPSTGYRIRVKASNPAITAADNGTDLIILPPNTVRVTFDSTTFPPTGWTNTKASGTNASALWSRETVGTHPDVDPKHGAGMVAYKSWDFQTTESALLTSPAFTLAQRPAGQPAFVGFWMYRDNGYNTALDKIIVYANTTPSLTNATAIDTINRVISSDPAVSGEGWYFNLIDLPASFNTSTNYLMLLADSQYGNDMYVDELFYQTYPTTEFTATVNVKALLQNYWNGTRQKPAAGIIELRSGADFYSSTLVARKSGICDTTGLTSCIFPNIAPGLYWIVYRHGGHLSVVSSARVSFSAANPTISFDFSDAATKAMNNGTIQSGTRWLLRSGDADANGMINALDYLQILNNFNTGSEVPEAE